MCVNVNVLRRRSELAIESPVFRLTNGDRAPGHTSETLFFLPSLSQSTPLSCCEGFKQLSRPDSRRRICSLLQNLIIAHHELELELFCSTFTNVIMWNSQLHSCHHCTSLLFSSLRKTAKNWWQLLQWSFILVHSQQCKRLSCSMHVRGA